MTSTRLIAGRDSIVVNLIYRSERLGLPDQEDRLPHQT